MIKNIIVTCATATFLAMPVLSNACPRTSPATALPLGIASSDTSSISFTLSNKGDFTVKRTLALGVPAEAVSCQVRLEGRYSRKLSYSATTLLGTISSLESVVSFRAKRLPSVKPERFRGQSVQPTLHVRVNTTCLDKDGDTVMTDTTPVVARYVQCGITLSSRSMETFISGLISKLNK